TLKGFALLNARLEMLLCLYTHQIETNKFAESKTSKCFRGWLRAQENLGAFGLKGSTLFSESNTKGFCSAQSPAGNAFRFVSSPDRNE
ncbi:MAG: hypothetical protein ABI123_09215, partial [Ginsengibacter sp.]